MTSPLGDVAERMVSVPGGEIFVKRWTPAAPRARAPLVLLHDSIGCVEMWRQFPLSLATRLQRPVIAYDRLGFGRSTECRGLPSVDFVSEEATVRFPVLRRELELDTFVVFGHSVGGSMAVVIAAEFPEACQAVITESAQAYVEERTLSAIAKAKELFTAPCELAKLEKYHDRKARWVVDAWTDVWLSSAFREWNVRREIAKVTCPLLAIHGDLDEYGSTAFPESLVATAGPSVKAVLADCHHVPHREREYVVLDAVQQFLDRFLSR
jgi:pimeloyl-ACP methyl ester carboxylesterase